jgi:hypothetical protein
VYFYELLYPNSNEMKSAVSLIYRKLITFSLLILVFLAGNSQVIHHKQSANSIGAAFFEVDATPPVGYQMAYDPVVKLWDMGLKAKGIVLTGIGNPVVLVSIDWIGIANESHDEFRIALAAAAGTIPERVAVHTIHQHDAPKGDIKDDFVLAVLHRLEIAVRQSLEKVHPVTHIGLGSAQVYEVASNRRILGEDGLVRATRYTATKDPVLRAEPEGLIDPLLSEVSLWNGDKPLIIMTFYATHPQSYYRTGCRTLIFQVLHVLKGSSNCRMSFMYILMAPAEISEPGNIMTVRMRCGEYWQTGLQME